jgi:hypothetical protein
MTKAAVIILAETEGHANLGRVVNGLETAREFAEADGDEVELVFDGAGTVVDPRTRSRGRRPARALPGRSGRRLGV